jgi:hypothetical protein
LQIRGLLIAQQNAEAARMQAEMDREAQQQAASEERAKAPSGPCPRVVGRVCMNWITPRVAAVFLAALLAGCGDKPRRKVMRK